MSRVSEGDTLAILDVGAYALSMASNYNMRPIPQAVMLHKGKTHIIRRKDSFEDLTRNEVIPENMRSK